MNPIAWNNFLNYSLQVGLLVGLAGWLPAAVQLRTPKARLAFFHALLVACLLLPAVRPWKNEVITVAIPTAVKPLPPSAAKLINQPTPIDPRDVVMLVLALGTLARLGMLAMGLFRLRRYRRSSTPLTPVPSWSVEADIRVSPDAGGPVTFGFLRPVILLPAHFSELPRDIQEAILCHETMHVRRRDWLFTVTEELIRAALWFHPAIWWVLGEIQLAREQAVDREALDVTNARDPYVDALLAAAGAPLHADFAPAPLFLRKRHLKQRVVSILKEKHMSKKRTFATLAASLAFLAGACWYVAGALPLTAQPQFIADGPGVAVDLQGSTVLHRSAVYYSREGLEKHIEGQVVAQVKVGDGGNVSDVSVLSGPDELRRTVIQSLLSWHFSKDAAGSTRQIVVTFRTPAPVQPPVIAEQGNRISVSAPPLPPPSSVQAAPGKGDPQTIHGFQVNGLAMATEDVVARLPVHVGDAWTNDTLNQLRTAAQEIDEHLVVSAIHGPDGVTVRLTAPHASQPEEARAVTPPPPPAPSAQVSVASGQPSVQGPITVGGRVQAAKLISNPQPIYPDLARQARISGTVEMAVIIGPDGYVREIHVISGHPLLRQAALDAVKDWVYQPTSLNNQPVSVQTTVDVIFTIGQ
jgi:TonB family protein